MNGMETKMNERAAVLVGTVMEMIDGTLATMEKDPFHAPAAWLLENWWHALNAALQVGNQLHSSLNSREATDQTASEKRDEDVQPDKPFKV